MLKMIKGMTIFSLAMLYFLSWTNLLHPTYNWWGFIVWSGQWWETLVK